MPSEMLDALSRNRSATRIRLPRALRGVLACALGSMLLLGLGESCGWAQPRPRITPTPTLSSVKAKQKEREEIYEGYARLFVLGHVLTRAVGIHGVLPQSIDLDVFNQSQLFADVGDVFIYRPTSRVDVMWPLLIPTPQSEPEELPTSTPTPEPEEVADATAEGLAATPTPTPTATPTPTEVIPPPLTLQGITVTPDTRFVVIANQILGIGDSLDQATIVDIQRHYAEIVYFGAPFFVTASGTVKAADFRPEDYEIGP